MKEADSVLLSLFMKDNSRCDIQPADQKTAPRIRINIGRLPKGSDDPIKSRNKNNNLNEVCMDAEESPSGPLRNHIP